MHTTFATVPDQRRTASLPLALHRIRDKSAFTSAYGVKPAGDARERPRVATCRRWIGYCVCSPAISFCRMRL